MRILRLTVAFLAVVVALASTGIILFNKGKLVAPVIKCSVDGDITVSVNVEDKDLLQFVTASDEQDGNLSANIRVIRKKYFIDDKTSVVTYSVSDSDGNVAVLQKRVYFEDYAPPTLDFKSDFIFQSGKTTGSLSSYVTAQDKFDDDLTDYVKIISTEFTNVKGRYPVNMKVSNSMGDIESITIDAIVTDDYSDDVRINLRKYLLYYDGNPEIDWMSYVESVKGGYGVENISVDTSELDLSKPGVSNVYYRINDYRGETVTFTRIIVVVREG